MTLTQIHTDHAPSADEFAERLFTSTLATAETMSIYLGERLGWYADLADHGPSTADDVAARTGTHRRYVREWLEMQAAFGILDADTTSTPPKFAIAPGVAEVLLDEHSLAYLGALPRMFAAAFTHLPELMSAYRRGGGVSWQALGADARECQAALNRPWFAQRLGPAIAGVDHIHRTLSRPGARILDVGFGGGWSTIALAQAYPEALFTGLDVDAESVAMARRNAADHGVADRVDFRLADGNTAGEAGTFDIAFAFECIHDMPRPVEVLRSVRAALVPGGSMVVMDEAVSGEFAGSADEVDRLMYGFSIFVCLPDGMCSEPSSATGTVMRPSVLDGYAKDAGFAGAATLPIDDFSFFRFYELTTRT